MSWIVRGREMLRRRRRRAPRHQIQELRLARALLHNRLLSDHRLLQALLALAQLLHPIRH